MTSTVMRWAALPTALALAGLGACGTDDTTIRSSGGGSTPVRASVADCPTGTVRGEGSSAQKNAIESAIKSFQTACPDATVNYNPSGSGAGIKNFDAGQVDFAGSDSVLKPDEAAAAQNRCAAPAWHLPMVVGPVAIAYHLAGVPDLVVNADVAAKIFEGVITTWNHPAIAALNPGKALPATPVKVYFRSDESGTTENFTQYLEAAAPSATLTPGKKWNGKTGEGKEKSAGVASAVKTQEGGITYVEWSYATQNKLGIAAVDNGSGPVTLSGTSAGKMVATARQRGPGNDLSLSLDYATKEPGAYPINLVTYQIVCSKYPDQATGHRVASFLGHFASPDVQKALEKEGYAPLPTELSGKVTNATRAIS